MPDHDEHTPPEDDSTAIELPPDHAPERIGPFKILEKIGEGGMGIVYLAEQQAPLRRRVALKVIKPGMDSKQVLARFEAERQALALMNHPAVAKVFDAGSTREGRPYFIMEHVAGIPITDYCDTHRLNNAQRLALFGQVCEAIQHAHQKGIIHRDIKPSNVLVALLDGEPRPKVIDFGIAKAIQQPLTEHTLFTQQGALIGTPEYMSPEQADMKALDIDTRTDVYSLGVVLYELIVGALPFEPKSFRAAGIDGIRQMIREVEPLKPSLRLGTLGGTRSSESAARRRVDVPTLRRQLAGDLDWITMKALEKDRARRYGSPAELGADVRRHLENEPVAAGPPNAAYRAGKFVRRHKFGVAVTALGVVLLLAFTATMGALLTRVAHERNRANLEAASWQQTSNFMMDLFRASAPSNSLGKTITLREVLDKGAERVGRELTSQPDLQVRLLLTIGATYVDLGLYRNAEPILERSVELSRRVLGEYNLLTLNTLDSLAGAYLGDGRFAEAERLLVEARSQRRLLQGADHPDTLASENSLATVYKREGRYAEAEQLYRATLEARLRVLGANDPSTLISMQNLAGVFSSSARHGEAQRLYQKIVDTERRVQGPDHPATLWALNGLGWAYLNQGRFAEAEKLFHEVLDSRRRVLGPDHQDTLATMSGLAELHRNRGRFASAQSLDDQTLSAQRRTLGPDHPDTLATLNSLGSDYLCQARFAEAERTFLEALEARRRVLGPDHPDTLRSACNLAYSWSRLDRGKDADELWRDIRARIRTSAGAARPETLLLLNWVGVALLDQARYTDAAEVFTEALDKSRRVLGDDDRITLWLMNGLGVAYRREGRYRDAEKLHVEALERCRRTFGTDDLITLQSMCILAGTYALEGRSKDAERLQDESLEDQERLLGDDHAQIRSTMYGYACITALRGDRTAALDWLRRAVERGCSADLIERDEDLRTLRNDHRFQALVAQARKYGRT